jgi:hypothetical protein
MTALRNPFDRALEVLLLISSFLLILSTMLGFSVGPGPAPESMSRTSVPNVANQMSVASCRRLVGPSIELSDPEVLLVRDQLYSIADCIIRTYESSTGLEEETALALVDAGDRDTVVERAAIFEFDAGRARGEATRIALASYVDACARKVGSKS